MGSKEIQGWAFKCGNPECGKEEMILRRKRVLSESGWLEGGMDTDSFHKEVPFTACSPECLKPAILAVLMAALSSGMAGISEVGGY